MVGKRGEDGRVWYEVSKNQRYKHGHRCNHMYMIYLLDIVDGNINSSGRLLPIQPPIEVVRIERIGSQVVKRRHCSEYVNHSSFMLAGMHFRPLPFQLFSGLAPGSLRNDVSSRHVSPVIPTSLALAVTKYSMLGMMQDGL